MFCKTARFTASLLLFVVTPTPFLDDLPHISVRIEAKASNAVRTGQRYGSSAVRVEAGAPSPKLNDSLTLQVVHRGWVQSATAVLDDRHVATIVSYVPIGYRVRGGFQIASGSWLLGPGQVVYLDRISDRDTAGDFDDDTGNVTVSVMRATGRVDPLILVDLNPYRAALSLVKHTSPFSFKAHALVEPAPL